MRSTSRVLTIGLFALLSVLVVITPTGYLGAIFAAATTFLETFDGTPSTPQDYTNPHNWDIFVQGFNDQEGAAGNNIAQHGPSCEPPGFPYTSSNSHPIRTKADTVFLCNNHVMTSLGLTGYGAVYMTPPALMDLSGTAVFRFDMSTLRTAARDWVDIVVMPYSEHQILAYNNNDQHVPPDNIHISLGGTNEWNVTERVSGGSDVPVSGDTFTTWDMVQQAQNPSLSEDSTRRDTFELDLSTNHIRFCITGNNTGQTYTYHGQTGFCWVDTNLPTPLSSSVWQNSATVEINHRDYNPEKSCTATEDSFGIDHTAQADQQCPPDTWHWDNVYINPAIPFTVIQPTQDFDLTNPNGGVVTFQQPAPPNTHVEFVTFGTNSALQLSFDGGASWRPAQFQPAFATGHDENGEMVWMPVPTGVSSIQVRGQNGFWGTYESTGFHMVSSSVPSGGPAPTATPTNLPPTSTPVPNSTATPTPGVGTASVVAFDDLSSPNRALTGQYPSNVFDWGGGAWWLSGPYGPDSSSSVSFNGGSLTSASINEVTPAILLQLDIINGGNSPSTVTLSCPGQTTVQTSAPVNQVWTVQTHWTAPCSTITFTSSNGWNTNFDNLVIQRTSGGSATPTPTPRATNTPTPSGSRTVTFDDLSNPQRPLTGQYPSSLIDWGSNGWWLSGPYGQFHSNSVSFVNGPTSASFNFVGAHTLVQLDIFNGGQTTTTVSLACGGQPTRTVTLAANQLMTVPTNWTGTCTTVTISSSNGWNTNFDNLVVR